MTTTLSPLGRALAYAGGTHSEADIALGVAEGRYQSWDCGDSVLITELRDTPGHRFLHFFLAEGNRAELEQLVPIALQWGREQGCTKASLVGRFGWLRSWVRQYGFRETACVMEVRL
jgi:hypothetical protein